MRCKICLRDFKKLRFYTKRLKICGTCANSLNGYHEVAEASYKLFSERLRVGMRNRATADLSSNQPAWKQERARWILNNFEEAYSEALSRWLNKLAGDRDKQEKEHKIIRAHRRGLLHLDRPKNWGYPSDWASIAKKIRNEDKTCVVCGVDGLELHVHHVVYKSNYGTDRKENLVCLCKHCHEKEHEREFDFGEQAGLESLNTTYSALQI